MNSNIVDVIYSRDEINFHVENIEMEPKRKIEFTTRTEIKKDLILA